MNNSLLVCEIFRSLQGESTNTGRICAFIRLAGCNLECSYCDTPYARSGGRMMSIEAILGVINGYATQLVEITGGEPLLQQGTVHLARQLLACRKTVLIETNGSLDIGPLPPECIRIVDIKCPSSGMQHSFMERNISRLRSGDEVKFVIGTREDFDWALSYVKHHSLESKCTILFSPVGGRLLPEELAQWILDADAPVRLQLQLHKILWGDKRGV